MSGKNGNAPNTPAHMHTHTHHPHTHAYMFIAEDNMQHKQENKVVNIWCATTPRGIPVIYAGFSKDCREAFNGLSLSGLFVSGIEWCMKTLELDCWRCNMNSRMRVEYPAFGCYSKLLRVSSLKLLRTYLYCLVSMMGSGLIRFFNRTLLVSYDRHYC